MSSWKSLALDKDISLTGLSGVVNLREAIMSTWYTMYIRSVIRLSGIPCTDGHNNAKGKRYDAATREGRGKDG